MNYLEIYFFFNFLKTSDSEFLQHSLSFREINFYFAKQSERNKNSNHDYLLLKQKIKEILALLIPPTNEMSFFNFYFTTKNKSFYNNPIKNYNYIIS